MGGERRLYSPSFRTIIRNILIMANNADKARDYINDMEKEYEEACDAFSSKEDENAELLRKIEEQEETIESFNDRVEGLLSLLGEKEIEIEQLKRIYQIC